MRSASLLALAVYLLCSTSGRQGCLALTTDGITILDGPGQEVEFHGINLPGKLQVSLLVALPRRPLASGGGSCNPLCRRRLRASATPLPRLC